MKRAGNLIERIADTDNLRLAFFKACRGKRGKAEVLRFRASLDSELRGLREELLSGSADWGEYHSFRVHDPKPRTIHAPPFRARVAHHAIINICEPAFENYQIFDSYACRKGKGLHAALDRATRFAQHGDWYLQMDVRKYFDSIDHAILKRLLRRRFKDRVVVSLFDSIIDSYETAPGKGVPIGNLTSQYFANHYLGLLDHYVKEELRYRRYARYMDDFVVWSESKACARSIRAGIEGFLYDRLSLELKPVNSNACERGMTFLGHRVFPGVTRLARRSRDRFRRKASRYIRLWEAGVWDEAELARHMEPLLAFVRRGTNRSFRQRCIAECGLCPEAQTA